MQTLVTYCNDMRLESSLNHALGVETLRRMAEEHDWGTKDRKPGKLNFPRRSSRPSRAKVRDVEVSLTENIPDESSLEDARRRERRFLQRLRRDAATYVPRRVDTDVWYAKGQRHVIYSCHYNLT